MMEEAQLPADLLFKSGREARKMLQLGNVSRTQYPTMKVTCSPCASAETKKKYIKCVNESLLVCPWVLAFDNFFSDSFRNKVLEMLNELPAVRDPSGNQKNCLRASLHSSASAGDANPAVIKMGTKKCLLTDEASIIELHLMNMQTEFVNIIIDAINCEVKRINGEELDEEVSWEDKFQLMVEEGKLQGNGEGNQKVGDAKPKKMQGIREENNQEDNAMKMARRSSRLKKRKFQHNDRRLGQQKPLLPPFRCNLEITKCGSDASYGWHQDSSWILNSHSSTIPTNLAGGNRLPTMSEMIVPTFILAGDKHETRTKVTHRRGGVTLSEIFTGFSSCHLQSPFCQACGIRHASESVVEGNTKMDTANACRCVLTGRMVIDPNKDRSQYLNGINDDDLEHNSIATRGVVLLNNYIYNNMCGVRKLMDQDSRKIVPLWTTKGGKSKIRLKKSGILKPGKFERLKKEHWDAFLDGAEGGIKFPEDVNNNMKRIRRPAIMVGIKNANPAKESVACHYKAASYFIRNNKIITVVDRKKKETALQPLFTLAGVPLYNGEKIEKDSLTDMKFTVYANTSMVPDQPTARCIFRVYKNEPDGIDAHLDFNRELERGFEEEDLKILGETYANLPVLKVGGSGGSAQDSGVYASAVNGRTDDAHSQTACNQSADCPSIVAMLACERRENAIAVFVDLAKWNKPVRIRPLLDEDKARERSKKEDTEEKYLNYLKGIKKTFQSDGKPQVIPKLKHVNDWEAWKRQRKGATNWDEDDENDDDELAAAADEDGITLAFLGYYYVSKHIVRSMKAEEVMARFRRFDQYERKEKDNLSYLYQKHYEFHMEPAFDFATVVKIMKDRKAGKENYIRQSLVCNGARLTMNKIDMIKFMENQRTKWETQCLEILYGTGGESAVPDLKPGDMVECTTGTPGLLEKKLGIEDQNVEGDGKKSSRLHSVLPSQLLDTMTMCSAAVAARYDRERSTRPGEDGKIYAIPPTAKGCDKLPDPLRRKPNPSPNPDADVQVCFYRGQVQRFLSTEKTEFKPLSGYTHSYQLPNLKEEGNCKVLAEMIFMAVVCRFTGNVPVLSTYGRWAKPNTKSLLLPTSCTVERFIDFLEAEPSNGMSGFMSKQYSGAIPDDFKNTRCGKRRFCRFLRIFGDLSNQTGLGGVLKYIQEEGRKGSKRLNRKGLLDSIMENIDNCSGLDYTEAMHFLIHKVLADFESAIPGITGDEIDTESIGFWKGSIAGISILTRDHKPANLYVKFDELYLDTLSYLHGASEYQLSSLGYYREVKDGCFIIRSLFTGRVFSKTDLEHWCCKIYLCVTSCHPSRTISANPIAYSYHCWPLPMIEEIDEWLNELSLKEVFQKMWEDFQKLDGVQYPVDLEFPA